MRRSLAPFAVGLGEPGLDDGVGDVVRDIPPGREDRLHLEPQRGLVLDVGAEDVAGRDRGDPEVLGDAGSLRALTGTGRAEDDQTHGHLRNPS